MSGRPMFKFTQCSFSRYVVYYACRKKLQTIRLNRKLLTVTNAGNPRQLNLSYLRQISTSCARLKDVGDGKDRKQESSSSGDSSDSSSSDSDEEPSRRPGSPQTIKAAVTGQKGTDVETIDVLMSRLKAKGEQPSGKVQPKKKGPQEGKAVSSKKKKPLFAAGGAEGGDPLSRTELDDAIIEAAKSVAEELQGDTTQIHKDLLSRLEHDHKTTKKQKMGKSPNAKKIPANAMAILKQMADSSKKTKEEAEVKSTVMASEKPEKLTDIADMINMTRKAPPAEKVEVTNDKPIKSTADIKPADKPIKSTPDIKPEVKKPHVKPDIFGKLLKDMPVMTKKKIEDDHILKKEQREKELAMEEKLLPTSRQKKSGFQGQGAEKRPGFQMPDTRRGRYYSDGFTSSGEFKGQAINAFTPEDMADFEGLPIKKTLFDIVKEEQSRESAYQPPSNAFEEQIRWTEEGKLWKFPIDNEQGWESEANVGFEQHIFLEDLLEDFPQDGPIRIFMEMVCMGMSKNPYLTVEQKQENIDWYKNYFEEKKAIIDESLEDMQAEVKQ